MKTPLLAILFSALALAQVPALQSAVPLPNPKVQLLDASGRPCAGCYLWTYAAGTSTPQATYTDSTAGTPNTNPVVLDAGGFANVWVGAQSYKLVLEKPPFVAGHGSVVWTVDNVTDTTFFYLTYLRSISDSALLTYTATGTGGTSRTVRAKLGDTVSVKDYGAVGDGSDATTAFTNAIATGKNVFVPKGEYGIASTMTLAATGQRVFGEGRENTILYKFGNSPVFLLTANYVGLEDMSIYGNYDKFGYLTRPAGAPSFTDTTDGVQIGTLGAGTPYGWRMRAVNVYFNGRDGVYWMDGPSGVVDGGFFNWNGRWGFNGVQTIPMGGTSLDASHLSATQMEATQNGRSSSYTEGGNIHLGGGGHSILNLKSFGSYGSGALLECSGSRFRYWSELNGRGNSDISSWGAGQTISAGDFRINAGNLYVSLNGGTSGGSAPTCTSSTCSDGAISWQFRPGLGLHVPSGTYQGNMVELSWMNTQDGYLVTGTNVVAGMTRSAAPSSFGFSEWRGKKLILNNEIDFANTDGSTGSYTALYFRTKPGGNGKQYNLEPANMSSSADISEIFIGDGTGSNGQLLLKGVEAAMSGVPVSRYVASVSGGIDLASVYTSFADVFLLDVSSGTAGADLDKGGVGATAGKVITLCKTDSSANTVNITAAGTIVNAASPAYIARQNACRSFVMTDASAGNWLELDLPYPFYRGTADDTVKLAADFSMDAGTKQVLGGIAFGNLGTPASGTFTWCTDCTIATPCAGGGAGAWAFRTATNWKCPF